MVRDEHNGIRYEDTSPLEVITHENRLGVLRFSVQAARSAAVYARIGGVSPEVGRWVTSRGDRMWELHMPDEAKMVFDGFARVLDSGMVGGAPLTDEARQRLYVLSMEIRNGVSQASSYHPDVAELDTLKRDMTRSLEGQLVEA